MQTAIFYDTSALTQIRSNVTLSQMSHHITLSWATLKYANVFIYKNPMLTK